MPMLPNRSHIARGDLAKWSPDYANNRPLCSSEPKCRPVARQNGTSPGRSIGARMRSESMLRIDVKREDDGQWLGEIPELPGVMAYGATEAEARANTIALAFQVMGERIAHG